METKYTNSTDEELLDGLRDNDDRKAFETLYGRYSIRIFDYIHARVNDRYTAQEIVQELFLGLWQKRATLSVQAFRPYLFSAAKNLIVSHYRKEMAREIRQKNWDAARSHQEEHTYQETLVQDLRARYGEGLRLLPEKCQRVFMLSRDGLSNREVADRLDISEKTVEQHITKAIRFLKVYLKEHLAYLLAFTTFF
ncbi:RNA polymerase sigma-70 factor [Salmonirosea aquatica]|uniref:RNA polymerase sigma-70 factor n=1 Tax=Salmonirosea aquatica TaxID=2654236 RepID=A0A7C9BJA0_9BACT|nr:RNA polymerase sigma-70 factor [Cytophagaceae bacterium SJW1-29]